MQKETPIGPAAAMAAENPTLLESLRIAAAAEPIQSVRLPKGLSTTTVDQLVGERMLAPYTIGAVGEPDRLHYRLSPLALHICKCAPAAATESRASGNRTSDEVRARVVEMLTSGQSIAATARDCGLHPSTVSRIRREDIAADVDGGSNDEELAA